MINRPTEVEAARLLIVGFVQCKNMLWLATMLGYHSQADRLIATVGDHYPFLAGSDPWAWFGRRTRLGAGSPLIRTHVANMWPHLFDYLDRHAQEPEKLLAAAEQVIKLRWANTRSQVLDKEAISERNKTKRAMLKHKEAGREIGQWIDKNPRAWGVVKGPVKGSRR